MPPDRIQTIHEDCACANFRMRDKDTELANGIFFSECNCFVFDQEMLSKISPMKLACASSNNQAQLF